MSEHTEGIQKLLDAALAIECPDEHCKAMLGELCVWLVGGEYVSVTRKRSGISDARMSLALLTRIEALEKGLCELPADPT